VAGRLALSDRSKEVGMRTIGRGLAVTLLVAVAVGHAVVAHAVPYEEQSAGRRAAYTAGAVAANVLPVAPTYVEPRCLVPYILCKAVFAGMALVAAGESLVMSGGADLEQPRAILYRGFSGDWVVTPRDVAGETKVDVLPAAPPPAREKEDGGFVPPPL
jgi:hypothetical protein